MMETLNKHSIENLMNAELLKMIDLEVFDEIDSTNTYLMNQKLTNKVKVCLSNYQTAGRGRYGKEWYSPSGSNIYLSFAQKLRLRVSQLSGLSLVTGIVLAETLQQYCRKIIDVKWPNDLLVETKKLSGILIEIKHQDDGYCEVISGLGVNIDLPLMVDKHISQPSISLNQCSPYKPISRNVIVADILSNMMQAMDSFESYGFAHFHQQWNQLDCWLDHPVELLIGQQRITGIHRGVDASGSLLLEQNGKLSRWNTGEVTLRGIV